MVITVGNSPTGPNLRPEWSTLALLKLRLLFNRFSHPTLTLSLTSCTVGALGFSHTVPELEDDDTDVPELDALNEIP